MSSFSLIIPVYKNVRDIERLVAELEVLNSKIDGELEVIFVVDSCPEGSYEELDKRFSNLGFRAQLLLLSKNFGSFNAIKAGLEYGKGPYFGVMAADLQEPPELITTFYKELQDGSCDIVIGERRSREDPFFGKLASKMFWSLYRYCINRSIPHGGADIFACNQTVRDRLVEFQERNSSLIGQLFWLGFKRKFVPYTRLAREHGTSAWTFSKKFRYLRDSIFSFTDLPIRLLIRIGSAGLVISLALASVVLFSKITNRIVVPGYTATISVITFFGGLNCLGLGIIGEYAWRAYENTKVRPNYVVAKRKLNRHE